MYPVVHSSYEIGDESDPSFLVSDDYCRVRYGHTHMISQYCHITDHDKFEMSWNRIYKSRFGPDGDFKRKYPSENPRQKSNRNQSRRNIIITHIGTRRKRDLHEEPTKRQLSLSFLARTRQLTTFKIPPQQRDCQHVISLLRQKTKDKGRRNGST